MLCAEMMEKIVFLDLRVLRCHFGLSAGCFASIKGFANVDVVLTFGNLSKQMCSV